MTTYDVDGFDRRQQEIDALTVSEDEKSELYQQSGRALAKSNGWDYNADKYQWSLEPPLEAETCRDCYEWRRYPIGQRHFGFAFWKRCHWDCGHSHHADEMWMAGISPAASAPS